MTVNLSTNYLGLHLEHPLIASASPLTSTVDGIRALEDAGAAAVVMPSLFEEQIRDEDTAYALYTDHGSYSQSEAGSYFRRCRTTTAASRGTSIRCGARWRPWTSGHREPERRHRRGLGQLRRPAGTGRGAALELNMYFIPADTTMSGQDVEAHYIEALRAVRRAAKIPVAVKLSPYFSSIGHMAHRLVEAGADGLVLFNRFYQPDFDLVTLAVEADLKLSSTHEAGPPFAVDQHARRQDQGVACRHERSRHRRAGHQIPVGRR
jgi:dihydroorotate dehydrogenase (fumarate)